MAELDLTEAIEAGTAAWLSDMGNWRSAEGRVEVMLTAAAPIIARQVREQVAAEIEAESAVRKRWANEASAARGGVRSHHDDGVRFGLDEAARIARGGAS